MEENEKMLRAEIALLNDEFQFTNLLLKNYKHDFKDAVIRTLDARLDKIFQLLEFKRNELRQVLLHSQQQEGGNN